VTKISPEEGARILTDVERHPRRELIEAIADATYDLANEHGPTGGGMWWHLSQALALVEMLPALTLDDNEPMNDIEATGRCCCAGCVGMGPCDRSDLIPDGEEPDRAAEYELARRTARRADDQPPG
jgi:hypothetical protein